MAEVHELELKAPNWRYRVEAAGAFAMLMVFRLFGLDRASALGGTLGRAIGPRLGTTKRARRNIKRAMPELSDEDVEAIVTAMWDNIGRTIAEYAFLEEFRRPENHHRFEIVNPDFYRGIATGERGLLCVSGHLANFELMPLALTLNGYEGAEVYRSANNPFINRWLVRTRSRAIVSGQIPKGPKGARQILRLLRRGSNVCMLVDQKMNDGVEARFFGLKAMTTLATGAMATRYGAAVVPVSMKRLEGARFRITVHPPIEADPNADDMQETLRIVQHVNDWLEETIREDPAQWLWLHNRWPDDAEKEAIPAPAGDTGRVAAG